MVFRSVTYSLIQLKISKLIALGVPLLITLLLISAFGIQACGHTSGGPRILGCP